ncbi:hypothetical protein ADL29_25065 [Streptomyces chattanoogensis]|uniref:Uncharacterized protein n=1 Tax=Streptomyces chattanoogensis TaxID=66876 RepID=A0A0N0GY85_9ACTN|nr:hypothetical protein ADL29_25065 [Streptomyces chattanoogensis]
MAEGDVVDVEEDFVLALFVPHLVAGIAGVGKDGANGTLGPCMAVAVPVAGTVMSGGAGDAVMGQALGDGVQALATQVVGEDADDYECGVGIRFEAAEVFAVGGLRGIGVPTREGEAVPVGRSAAEVAAFDPGLGGHGGADADLDAVAFALAHAAEDGHDQVVGFVVGVDGPADLGDPQRHAEVDEEGEGITELVAVEGALRFADDDGIEAAVGVAKGFEEGGRLRAAFPGEGTGVTGVEVLGDDCAPGGFDEGSGAGELPVAGGLGVLEVLGGAASGEGESGHGRLFGDHGAGTADDDDPWYLLLEEEGQLSAVPAG